MSTSKPGTAPHLVTELNPKGIKPGMASTGNYFTRIYERAADMVNQVRHVSSDETRPLLHGQGQRSYQGTEDDSIPVPKPRPVVTPVKVEAKVWFANERTWISWLRASLLLGTLALALFNSATYYDPKTSTDPMVPDYEGRPRAAKAIRTFGLVYALISAFVLLWGLYSYQRRVTLIKMRWPGSFDDLIGPPLVCGATFIAVLANFIVAVHQYLE